jgi:hypothetical protein
MQLQGALERLSHRAIVVCHQNEHALSVPRDVRFG